MKSLLKEYIEHSYFRLRKNHYELITASIFIHILALSIPISISLFFDLVLPNQSIMTAITLFTAVIIVVVFDASLRYARIFLVEKVAISNDTETEKKADKIIHNSYRLLSNKKDQVHSIKQLKKNILNIIALERSTFIIPALDIVSSCIYIVAIYLIAGLIVIVPLLFSLTVIVFGTLFAVHNWKIEKEYIQIGSEKNIHEAETMGNIEQVILNRWSDHTDEQISEIDDYQTKQSYSRSVSQKFSMVMNGATQFQTITVLFAGFFAITLQSLSAGGLFATLMLSGRLMSSIGGIYNVVSQVLRHKDAIEEVKLLGDEIKTKESVMLAEKLKNFNGVVEMENVSLNYDDKPAIIDMNLNFKPGEKIAVIGANGSGKSSLLRLIVGLSIPSTGNIFYSGIVHSHIEHDSLLKNINLLLQPPMLFKGTVGSNLGVGRNDVTYDEVMSKISDFKFCDFITKSGLGLNIPLESNGRNLCAGHRQVISIMRCILSDAKIILLDEPTLGLHQKDSEELVDWISNTPKGVFAASHDKQLIQHMNRIIELKNGRCLSDRVVASKKNPRLIKVRELKRDTKEYNE